MSGFIVHEYCIKMKKAAKSSYTSAGPDVEKESEAFYKPCLFLKWSYTRSLALCESMHWIFSSILKFQWLAYCHCGSKKIEQSKTFDFKAFWKPTVEWYETLTEHVYKGSSDLIFIGNAFSLFVQTIKGNPAKSILVFVPLQHFRASIFYKPGSKANLFFH